ncbi:MAG TPA: ester cyclase, partial [Anaerolineae bacterium]|nr:ester cyclase [Anaerolineae bacterium]MCB0180499.1 ester cyclase [Anaerolineae bacterium]MCB9105680.1 ester cyclase [Anaerolineales bacterium]HRV96043.1 ester cyclase [Anaerolineae bacterium]
MDIEKNKALVQAYLELWNTGDETKVEDILSADFVDHAHPEVKGIDQFKITLKKTKEFFPDFFISPVLVCAEEDHVTVLGNTKRTVQGELKVAEILWLFRISSGKIAEWKTGIVSSEK